MILIIGISPIVLIVLGAVLILNLPVSAVIALVVITALSLMGSLAICALIASRMSPKIRHEPERTYRVDRVYRPEESLSDWSFTEVSGSPSISEVEPPKTYKRLVGRRVVEFDAETHQPVENVREVE